MTGFYLFIFGANAFLSIVLSLLYLHEKESVKAVLSGICALPLIILTGYHWRHALIISGKNVAWLGFERYPFVVVTLLVLLTISLICIVKGLCQIKDKS